MTEQEKYIENKFLDLCGDFNDTNPSHDWEKQAKETIEKIYSDGRQSGINEAKRVFKLL